jgi:hypothetical protein
MPHTPNTTLVADYFNHKHIPSRYSKALPSTPTSVSDLTNQARTPNITRSNTASPACNRRRHASRYSKVLPPTPSSISDIFSATSPLPSLSHDRDVPKSLRTSRRVKTWEPVTRKVEDRGSWPKPQRPPTTRRHSSSEEEIYFLRLRPSTWPSKDASPAPAHPPQERSPQATQERLSLLHRHVLDSSDRYAKEVESMWSIMRDRIESITESMRDEYRGDEKASVRLDGRLDLMEEYGKLFEVATVGAESTKEWRVRDTETKREKEERRKGVVCL